MKLRTLLKETKGVFKPPRKTYYLGKLNFGTPYFYPVNFNSTIISVRKLKLRSPEELEKKNTDYPYNKNKPVNKYSNWPMVNRSYTTIIKLFRCDYLIKCGWPISISLINLGWKDKYETPRYEWTPQFTILFFGLQFCIWWSAPKLSGEKYPNNDLYYEMILRYLFYSNKNIETAGNEWGWVNSQTKKSTWQKEYLV